MLGSIISSTDAAAVFAILRAKKISLKNSIAPLLELESGSNDPMAIFLTMTIFQMISLNSTPSASEWAITLVKQFGIGIAIGYLFGVALPAIFNRLRLKSWGLYPVFSIAWTMQIVVFLTLGLLVNPSQLPATALLALVLALWLMFFARPLGVFASLAFSKFKINEQIFISWVGLRGVVPVVLATYVYVDGVRDADMIFNIIFFMVLISILIQGMSLGFAADKFKVKESEQEDVKAVENSPILSYTLHQHTIHYGSKLIGKDLAQLELPTEFLIILIKRKNEYQKPTGSTIFEENDLLLIQCENQVLYQDTIKYLTY